MREELGDLMIWPFHKRCSVALPICLALVSQLNFCLLQGLERTLHHVSNVSLRCRKRRNVRKWSKEKSETYKLWLKSWMFDSKRDFIVLSLLSPFTHLQHLQHLHLQCCLEIDQIGILPGLKQCKVKSFKLVIVWPKIDTLHTWKYMGKTVFGIQPEHIGHIGRFRVLCIPSAALMPRFALWSCNLWMLGRRTSERITMNDNWISKSTSK